MTNLIFDESEIFESDGWKQRMSANGDILEAVWQNDFY